MSVSVTTTDILTFLYCCAVQLPVPTPPDTHLMFQKMAAILLPHTPAVRLETIDTMVLMSVIHCAIDPLTFNFDAIATRYIHGDITPAVWGPIAWSILHQMATTEQVYHIKCILHYWTELLPCPECRRHLREYIANVPYPRANCVGQLITHMTDYISTLHNAVNQRLGKSPFSGERACPDEAGHKAPTG